MARCRWQDSQKSYIAVEKALTAVAKQNGGPIQHIFSWSVDWYELQWRSGVPCVQTTTWMTNCLQTLFYDVQYYFVCITANMEAFYRHIRRCLLITYMLFCWFISPTVLHNAMRKFRDVFSGHPVYAVWLQQCDGSPCDRAHCNLEVVFPIAGEDNCQ